MRGHAIAGHKQLCQEQDRQLFPVVTSMLNVTICDSICCVCTQYGEFCHRILLQVKAMLSYMKSENSCHGNKTTFS